MTTFEKGSLSALAQKEFQLKVNARTRAHKFTCGPTPALDVARSDSAFRRDAYVHQELMMGRRRGGIAKP